MNESTEQPVIIYDIVSLPDFSPEEIVSFRDLFDSFLREKIVLWDSSKGGVEPRVIPPGKYDIKDVNAES